MSRRTASSAPASAWRRRGVQGLPAYGGRGARLTCYSPAVDAQFLTIIGIVLAVGFGLAGLMIWTTARLDRRIDNDKKAADADRRAYQAAANADRRAHQARFDTAMDAFRTEMQRLAERQSHVEGRVAERGAAAD